MDDVLAIVKPYSDKIVTEGIALAALRKIANASIPDQPESSAGNELAWAQQHVARLRGIAREAIAQIEGSSLSSAEYSGSRK